MQLARAAAREGATAREVEVAEAMRRQASASRHDELGAWAVAAQYRSAPRTTGAAWSASLVDGRLVVFVTEGQAHGVVAALATAALTGAFAAATTLSPAVPDAPRVTPAAALDELIATLRASADRVLRGGAPIAAFVAILDAEARTIAWASAGHPGALVVAPGAEPVSLGGGGAALGDPTATSARGEATVGADSVIVVASTGARGLDADRWRARVRDHATAGPWLAALLLEAAAGAPLTDDLLAVVIRQRRA